MEEKIKMLIFIKKLCTDIFLLSLSSKVWVAKMAIYVHMHTYIMHVYTYSEILPLKKSFWKNFMRVGAKKWEKKAKDEELIFKLKKTLLGTKEVTIPSYFITKY